MDGPSFLHYGIAVYNRAITYYTGENFPTLLLTVFDKNEKDNLTKAERNALALLTTTLLDGLRRTKK